MQRSYAIKIIILCILAAAANYGLNTLLVYTFKVPLFLDTLFTAAVCFSAGLVPGLLTALLTQTATGIREWTFTPFVLCMVAEVLLICLLNLVPVKNQNRNLQRGFPNSRPAASLAKIAAGLLLLYIVASISISVLGGIIDYLYHGIRLSPKTYFSAEDIIKIALLPSGLPLLAENILSRIPINIVDRFIVIFGGFFLSRGIKRLL